MFGTGIVLMAIAAILGPIPGPGGTPVFVAGLVLVLKSSVWAKRHYVRVKRWKPKAGQWMDWALRRRNARGRKMIRRAQPSGKAN